MVGPARFAASARLLTAVFRHRPLRVGGIGSSEASQPASKARPTGTAQSSFRMAVSLIPVVYRAALFDHSTEHFRGYQSRANERIPQKRRNGTVAHVPKRTEAAIGMTASLHAFRTDGKFRTHGDR
jgi:hypothetical protein